MNNYVTLLILKLLNQVTHFEEIKKRKTIACQRSYLHYTHWYATYAKYAFYAMRVLSLGASKNAAKVSTGSEVGLTNMPCEILPGDERFLGRRQVRALGRAANN